MKINKEKLLDILAWSILIIFLTVGIVVLLKIIIIIIGTINESIIFRY